VAPVPALVPTPAATLDRALPFPPVLRKLRAAILLPRLLSHSSKVGRSGLSLLLRRRPSGMVAPSRCRQVASCSSVTSAALRWAPLRSAPLMSTIGRFLAIRPGSYKNCTTRALRSPSSLGSTVSVRARATELKLSPGRALYNDGRSLLEGINMADIWSR